MKNNNIEKPFLVVVMLIFTVIGALHFARLSLGWDVLLDNWNVPTLLSGFIILVSVFIIYWAWIILNQQKDEEGDKEKSLGEPEGENKSFN